MRDDQSVEAKWRYFYGGEYTRLYRCPANGKRIDDQEIADVHLLWLDGSWLPGYGLTIQREMMKGWFAERGDEISESDMEELVSRWKAKGWPKDY